ncbi:MAG: hypothetical protein U0T75_12475 [Chitinophagales bacterium]
MKAFVSTLTLLLLFSASQLYGKRDFIDVLHDMQTERVERYSLLSTDPIPILVRMDFNTDSVVNPQVWAKLRGIQADRIDLVYTVYRESKSFNQPALNKSRMDTLRQYAPWLFASEVTDWHFIGQTAGVTQDSASKLFHGFVIYPHKTTPDVAEELRSISSILDSVEAFTKMHDSICIVNSMRMHSYYAITGFYLPRYPMLAKAGAKSTIKNWRFPRQEKVLLIDTTLHRDTVHCIAGTIDFRIFQFMPDSAVLKVFSRHQEWKDKLILTDVTGSMAPYSAQLLVWYKLREGMEDVKRFEFFNDGDNKPDYAKRIGSTGGIYFSPGDKGYSMMERTVRSAMKSGSGGDTPENNIEALLKGIENCPECRDIVMIADNMAPVKDMGLLKEVKRPVKIILCGASNGYYNTDYLEIARQTGGSVHTLEADITDLAKLTEGQQLVIGNSTYQVIMGKLCLVKRI